MRSKTSWEFRESRHNTQSYRKLKDSLQIKRLDNTAVTLLAFFAPTRVTQRSISADQIYAVLVSRLGASQPQFHSSSWWVHMAEDTEDQVLVVISDEEASDTAAEFIR